MTYHAAKLKDNVGRIYDCFVGWFEPGRQWHVICVRKQWSTYIEPERVGFPSARNVAYEALVERGIDEGVEREEPALDARNPNGKAVRRVCCQKGSDPSATVKGETNVAC